MLTAEVKEYIDRCVLCWLATANKENEPNVSPKEMFTYLDDTTLVIAHLASPVSIANIRINPKVCVSFVDIFLQKGFKLKGIAKLIEQGDKEFRSKSEKLIKLFSAKYPIKALIEIEITKVNSILAPNYFLFKETTEQSQIENAMITYNVQPRAELIIDPETAWKLFPKSLRPNQVADKVTITGDRDLGKVALEMISVMA